MLIDIRPREDPVYQRSIANVSVKGFKHAILFDAMLKAEKPKHRNMEAICQKTNAVAGKRVKLSIYVSVMPSTTISCASYATPALNAFT